MVPLSRLVRADDEMSVQGSATSRAPFPHPSAGEPDVPVASVEPENFITASVHESR